MLLLAEFLPWAGPGIGRAAQGPGDFPCQEEGFKPVPQMPPGLRGKVTQVEILTLLHDLGPGGGGWCGGVEICAKGICVLIWD